MSTTSTAAEAAAPAKAHEGINVRRLFVLSCLCLATTSFSFILRGSIAGDLKTELFDPIDPAHSAALLGSALGWAFPGFALMVLIGSAVVDFLGMRTMLLLCGANFIVGPLLVIGADKIAPGNASTIVAIGMLLNGLGWGCSETVINPLTTAIYPDKDEKTHRLNVLHAWWPAGIIIGGLLAIAASSMKIGWRVEFGILLLPAVAILALAAGTKFPKTERVSAGVTSSEMYMTALKPGFLLFLGAMLLTASSELAPGQWVDMALTRTVGMRGTLLMVYVAGLMFVMRHFAGTMVKRLSAVGLLWCSCLLAAIGLVALSMANSPVTGFLAATIWGIGVCYMWPTMLSIAAVRYPKSGAFGMGLIGSAGAAAIQFVLPKMGAIFDQAKTDAVGQGLAPEKVEAVASAASFQFVAMLPAVLLVVFGAVWLNDKRKGGFKAEQISGSDATMNRTSLDHGIKPTAAEVSCVLPAKALIGEGPMWSVAEQRLYWADIVGKQLNIFNPADGSNQVFDLPELVTSIAPRKSGGLILTLRSSFAFFDPKTGKLDKLAEPEPDKPGNRFNDGKCDRQGRMWGGTMGDVEWDQPLGSLYRFDANRKVTRVEEGVCCSNGLGWSPDSKTMYFTESFKHRIFAYDFDAATGNVSNRRVFVTVDPHGSAFPDGLTVDAEGHVWCAQPMFGRLARYAPNGKLERIIELPVSRGTSVMFGGPNLDILYVTTMRETLTDAQLAEEPLAGSLLALRPGVKGLPETPFAG